MTTVTNSQSESDTWSIAGAKAHLSELVSRARGRGPQTITRHGRRAVVVVAVEEWERKTRREESLIDFFARSPLRGADDLIIERRSDLPSEGVL